MLSPFTPHVCEELWEGLGYDGGIATAGWPTYDPTVAQADEIVVPVQVNGRVRARLSVDSGISKQALEEAALVDPKVQAHTARSDHCPCRRRAWQACQRRDTISV